MAYPKVANCYWELHCSKIPVRSEHDKAEEFGVSACGDVQVFVVTGQPGMGSFLIYPDSARSWEFSSGKSTFLFRPLLRRLGLKFPTVLQVHPNFALIFFEGG